MFLNKVYAKYCVVADQGAKMIEQHIADAKDELEEIEKMLASARDQFTTEYEKGADASSDKLEKLEDDINDLEEQHDEAVKAYNQAMETTLEDLEADQRYDDWKSNR